MTVAQRISTALRAIPSWLVYLVGAMIPLWYLYLAMTGQMGAEPIKTLEHAVGLLSLQALIATLAVTPVRNWTGVSFLMHRRALGNLAFYYILCHLLVWLVLDVQFAGVWEDIVKRPYITIGMFGFVALIPLALTSNNWAVKRLGPVRWRRIHTLMYPACLAGAVHFVMLSKTWEPESLIYLAIMVILLATRLPRLKRRVFA